MKAATWQQQKLFHKRTIYFQRCNFKRSVLSHGCCFIRTFSVCPAETGSLVESYTCRGAGRRPLLLLQASSPPPVLLTSDRTRPLRWLRVLVCVSNEICDARSKCDTSQPVYHFCVETVIPFEHFRCMSSLSSLCSEIHFGCTPVISCWHCTARKPLFFFLKKIFHGHMIWRRNA